MLDSELCAEEARARFSHTKAIFEHLERHDALPSFYSPRPQRSTSAITSAIFDAKRAPFDAAAPPPPLPPPSSSSATAAAAVAAPLPPLTNAVAVTPLKRAPPVPPKPSVVSTLLNDDGERNFRRSKLRVLATRARSARRLLSPLAI